MSLITDQACEILQLTNDGDDLSGRHLSLIQGAVNNDLNQRGLDAFAELYVQVKSGTYVDWYFGIEHLKLRPDGYVTWKDEIVEHYSFHTGGNYGEEAHKAALELAEKCRRGE